MKKSLIWNNANVQTTILVYCETGKLFHLTMSLESSSKWSAAGIEPPTSHSKPCAAPKKLSKSEYAVVLMNLDSSLSHIVYFLC